MITRDWIRQHCMSSDSRRLVSRVATKRWWELRGWLDLLQQSGIDPATDDIVEKLYCIDAGISRPPMCECCGKTQTEFQNFKSGYRRLCSMQCVHDSPSRNAKISRKLKAAMPKRVEDRRQQFGSYGFEDPIARQKATLRRADLYRPGSVSHALAQSKRETTCLLRYGASDPLTLPEMQEKMLSAKLAKWGQCVPGNEVITTSKAEDEVRSVFEAATGKPFPSAYGVIDRGYQLDGYCAELNMAFEYCGLYWHSSKFRRAFYHRLKSKLCEQRGIRLFTIFEDEWIERRDQVVSFIRAACGVYDRKIGARKCRPETYEHQPAEVAVFFKKNHIQGPSQGSTRSVVLRHDGAIVAAMTFRRHQRQDGMWTLSRLAFESGTSVVGGSRRMLAKAVEVWFANTGFVTWSDNRWTDGASYARLGLRCTSTLSPDYSYVKRQKRYSKQSCQKRLIGCPAGTTESAFMSDMGFLKIYDCGKRRWEYVPPGGS